jgi:large subunit ribosomal protein L25
MAAETKVVAATRTVKGKSEVRRMRADGRLPAIVYGGENDPRCIEVNQHDFELLLQHHRSESMILDLEVDGKKSFKVLLKDVQHDPVSGDVQHIDFVEVSMTKVMRVNVPTKLVGEPVGVSQAGGILEHLLREVTVECLPTDLMEEIEIDVAALEIGDIIQVGDLQVGDKIKITTDAGIAVASVAAPRLEETPVVEEGEEGAEVAEGEAGAEGEAPAAEEGAEAAKSEAS